MIFDSVKTSYNPFAEENSNTNRIRALILVQTDLVRDILTDRERDIVKQVIIKEFSQIQTAMLLGIAPSTVSRELKRALKKLRKYLHYCDLALKYYESQNST